MDDATNINALMQMPGTLYYIKVRNAGVISLLSLHPPIMDIERARNSIILSTDGHCKISVLRFAWRMKFNSRPDDGRGEGVGGGDDIPEKV